MKSLSACNENVAHMEEQPYSGKNKVQESIDANNICHMKSEDSDLFKQHFSSLSTTHAVSTVACCSAYSFLGFVPVINL